MDSMSDVNISQKQDPPVEPVQVLETPSLGKVDSGYSRLIAFTGFAISFMVFGTSSIFGVYMVHYASHEFANESKSLLSLVGGLGPAIFAISCVPSGILVGKIGHRATIFIAAVVFGAGLLIASFATQLWHLFIGQAVFIGISVSLSFIPTVSIVPQWFDKNRGIAMGVTAAGSGVGGLVLAPMIQAIIDSIGIRWALRVNAIIGIVVLISCGFVIRPRLAFQPQKQIFNTEILKDKRFIAMWGMGFASCFAYWTPFFLMPLYCKHYDIPATTASLIVGIMNGASAVGRVFMGKLSDKLGNVNSLLFSHFVVSLSFVLIWYFATVTWSLIVFSIIFGFFSGAFYTLVALITPQLFGLEKLAQANGSYYTCSTPGFLLGTLISTAIVNIHTTESGVNYLPMQLYLFACYFLSCMSMIWLRVQVSRKWIVKV